MNIWADFARTGNPSCDDLVWERYDRKLRATMVLCRTPQLKYDVLKRQRELLSPLLKYMINASYTELDLNVPFVRKAAAKAVAAAASATLLVILLRKLFKEK